MSEPVRDASASERASEVARLIVAAVEGDDTDRDVARHEITTLTSEVSDWSDADVAAAVLAVADLEGADVPHSWRWRITSIVVSAIEEQDARVGALAADSLERVRADAERHPGQLEARRVIDTIQRVLDA